MRTFLLLAMAVEAHATPFDLTHTGRLLDATGHPLHGAHSVAVNLYVANSSVWNRTYPSAAFEGGYYTVTLDGLDSAWFGNDVQIGVAVDGGPELSPRQTLTSVPRALSSDEALHAVSADQASHALTADVASRVAVSSSTPSGACPSEGALLWDRQANTLRVCNQSLTWTEIDPGAPAVGGRYEHVLTMNSAGTVTSGDWTDARNRVIGGQDCVVRFDERLTRAEYIEWTATSLRFDFQPLQAWHNHWDAYAFAEFTQGTRAGLGASYRRGHADNVHLVSDTQHPIASFVPMEVKLYCEASPSFTQVAAFNASGGATQGSYDALYAAAIDRNALCKVRWGNRLHVAHHVEQQGTTLYFDFQGLEAKHDAYDAYAYIKVVKDSMVRLGSTYRRGHAANARSNVRGFDREQYSEATQTATAVEVFCADAYTDTWAINGSGVMTEGTWSTLLSAVTDQGRECRVGYNQRVSTPRYVEYSGNTLEFNFDNLAAWHDGWDSYAAVRMQNGSYAGLDSTYRRGVADNVIQKSATQHGWQGLTNYPVTVRCQPGAYTHVMSLSSGGVPLYGDWGDYYASMASHAGAPDCKLRFDGRIFEPEVIETTGDGFYFDAQQLGAYHDNWDSYASFYLRAYQPTGLAGTYRRGHASSSNAVYLRDRAQHPLGTMSPYQVDVLCR
jgi:hypothetical protein